MWEAHAIDAHAHERACINTLSTVGGNKRGYKTDWRAKRSRRSESKRNQRLRCWDGWKRGVVGLGESEVGGGGKPEKGSAEQTKRSERERRAIWKRSNRNTYNHRFVAARGFVLFFLSRRGGCKMLVYLLSSCFSCCLLGDVRCNCCAFRVVVFVSSCLLHRLCASVWGLSVLRALLFVSVLLFCRRRQCTTQTDAAARHRPRPPPLPPPPTSAGRSGRFRSIIIPLRGRRRSNGRQRFERPHGQ